MIFETKFNHGDKVWKIVNEKQKEWKVCSFCNGSRFIIGSDNTQERCPKCYGSGGKYEYTDKGWHVAKELTIGQVRIEYRGKSDGIKQGPIKFDNYGAQTELYKEEYMCVETGIGSGSIHYADTLFATKEEGEKRCWELNNEQTE